MNNIDERGLVIVISEYGKIKRQYHDNDLQRFLKISKDLIIDHLDKNSKQGTEEIKNITINIYTN